jgi:VanZ family protein
MLKFIKNYWAHLTFFNLTVITVLSLFPLEKLPPISGNDKTHHLIAYSALMFPVALKKPIHWKFIGLIFIIYSGLIELVQPYINRYGEWLDMAANTAGIILGIFIARLLIFSFQLPPQNPE